MNPTRAGGVLLDEVWDEHAQTHQGRPLSVDDEFDRAFEACLLLGAAIRPAWPVTAPRLTVPRFETQSLKEQAVQDLRPALRVLFAAVVAVLLIVCANVANLLLARATVRQREIAVRLAIGASRGRIIRQSLTEGAVFALAGGALGAMPGAAGILLVRQLAAVDAPGIFRLMFGSTILPRGHEVTVNVRVLGIALGTAAITSIAFGVLPAWHLSRTDHLYAIGSRGSGTGRAAARTPAALVVAQLIMATALVVGAALLTRSFVKLSTVDTGYDPSHVLAFNLLMPDQYSTARKADAIAALLARFRATAVVRAVGLRAMAC